MNTVRPLTSETLKMILNPRNNFESNAVAYNFIIKIFECKIAVTLLTIFLKVNTNKNCKTGLISKVPPPPHLNKGFYSTLITDGRSGWPVQDINSGKFVSLSVDRPKHTDAAPFLYIWMSELYSLTEGGGENVCLFVCDCDRDLTLWQISMKIYTHGFGHKILFDFVNLSWIAQTVLKWRIF